MMHRKRDGKQYLFDDHHFGFVGEPEDQESVMKGISSKSVTVKVNESNMDRKNLPLEIILKLARKTKIHNKEIRFENMHVWYQQFMSRLDKSDDHELFPQFPVIVNEILIKMVPELGFLGFKDESYDNPDPMIIAKETADYDRLLRVGFEEMSNPVIKGRLHSNCKATYHEGYSLPGRKLFSYMEGPYGEDDYETKYYEILLGEDGFVYFRVDDEFDGGDWCFIYRTYDIYKLKLSTFLDTFAVWKGCVPLGETLFPVERGPTHAPRDGENDDDFLGWVDMIRESWKPIVRINTKITMSKSDYASPFGEMM